MDNEKLETFFKVTRKFAITAFIFAFLGLVTTIMLDDIKLFCNIFTDCVDIKKIISYFVYVLFGIYVAIVFLTSYLYLRQDEDFRKRVSILSKIFFPILGVLLVFALAEFRSPSECRGFFAICINYWLLSFNISLGVFISLIIIIALFKLFKNKRTSYILYIPAAVGLIILIMEFLYK